MRKITEAVIGAFYQKRSMTSGNSSVLVDGDETTMYLHGNAIAKLSDRGLFITTAGWDTRTTKERLNGLHGVSVNHAAHNLYLNGKRWDGEWIKVA